MVKIVLHIFAIAIVLYGAWTIDILSLETANNRYYHFGIVLLLFSFAEVVVHPILRLVLLPIRFLSFGIFSVVLSAMLIYTVVFIYDPLQIMWIYVVPLSIIFMLLQKLLR